MADSKESREVENVELLKVDEEGFHYSDGSIMSRDKTDGNFYMHKPNGERLLLANYTGDKTSDISIKVTADVNDAITGFKALSRELRETTKAARELESAYKDVEESIKYTPMQIDENGKLSFVSTPNNSIYLDGKKVGEAITPKLSEADEYIELIAYDIAEKLPIHYDDAVELLRNVSIGRTDSMLKRWRDGIKCSPVLSEVTTKELHEELSKREGVEVYNVAPHEGKARIRVEDKLFGYTKTVEGPARILVIKD